MKKQQQFLIGKILMSIEQVNNILDELEYLARAALLVLKDPQSEEQYLDAREVFLDTCLKIGEIQGGTK